MANDDNPLTGAGLAPCFASPIRDLADAIHASTGPGGSEGVAPRSTETHLLTIRANARKGTPGLYDALDAVRLAVRAFEDIDRRQATLAPHGAELLTAARSHALAALEFLAAVLRVAQPNA